MTLNRQSSGKDGPKTSNPMKAGDKPRKSATGARGAKISVFHLFMRLGHAFSEGVSLMDEPQITGIRWGPGAKSGQFYMYDDEFAPGRIVGRIQDCGDGTWTCWLDGTPRGSARSEIE